MVGLPLGPTSPGPGPFDLTGRLDGGEGREKEGPAGFSWPD